MKRTNERPKVIHRIAWKYLFLASSPRPRATTKSISDRGSKIGQTVT